MAWAAAQANAPIFAQTPPGSTAVDCTTAHLEAREKKLGIPAGALARLVRESVVSVFMNRAGESCSGVVYQDRDHVLTNIHCLGGLSEGLVVSSDLKPVRVAKVTKYGGQAEDLALLELAPHDVDWKPIEFKRDPAVGDRLMALPGCMLHLTGREPAGGHSAGLALREGSISGGENAVSIGVNFHGTPGKSGSLIVNQRGEPVALTHGTMVVQVLRYRTQKMPVPYAYQEYSAIKGKTIAASLVDVPKASQAVGAWPAFMRSTLAGQATLLQIGGFSGAEREKALAAVKRRIDADPQAYALRYIWALARASANGAVDDEILCTLGEIDDVFFNPVSSLFRVLLAQGNGTNPVPSEAVAVLERILADYAQQENIPALAYLERYYAEIRRPDDFRRIQALSTAANDAYGKRESDLNGP